MPEQERPAHPAARHRAPNRDNVLLTAEGAAEGRLRLLAIDFSHSFTAGREITPKVANISLVQDEGIDWTSVGFLTADDKVLPFGTDSKVISTVFETFVGPLIYRVAEEFGFVVEGARQTVYPDFTLSPLRTQRPRIAVDVKTTYRTR
ncbi:MAG: hypothetical protein IIB13_06655, partial [Chloroflexi bacterium]|nr:hypothetical protein [Chloroflexota bacterium]